MTFDDYKKIPDELKRRNSRAEIIFTGGEPLRLPLTVPVAQYAKNLEFARKLMTNATLIDAGKVKALVDSFDEFKISVDGSDASKHDFYCGNGSFARTIKAVDLLDEFSADVIAVTKKCRRHCRSRADFRRAIFANTSVLRLSTG